MTLTWNKCVAVALLAAAWMTLAGCTGAPEAVEPEAKIFYPPPPDEPRVQFLLSFNDADRWLTRSSSFAEFIVGQQESQSTGIANPYGLAARDGRIYVCDLGSRRVRVYDLVKNTYSELGNKDLIRNPVNIAIDADGTKYVCDTEANQVVVFDANDQFVRFMGDPQRVSPIDVAISGDELFVANVLGGQVEVWSRQGELLRTISSRGFGPSQLRVPTNLAIGPDGNVYVVDTELRTVKVFSPQGDYVRAIGAPGDRPGYFARPKGIAIDDQGRVIVVDAVWELVQFFTTDGRLLMFFGEVTGGPESLGVPAGVAVDASSVETFRKFIDPDFDAQYIFLVANQWGRHKIGVYAFGHRKGTVPVEAGPMPAEAKPIEATDETPEPVAEESTPVVATQEAPEAVAASQPSQPAATQPAAATEPAESPAQ